MAPPEAWLNSLSEAIFGDPEYKLFGVFLGLLGTGIAVWWKVRRDAWFAVYSDKRRMIEEFVLTLDSFAMNVERLRQLQAERNASPITKVAYINGFLNIHFGPSLSKTENDLVAAIEREIARGLNAPPNAPEAAIKGPIEKARGFCEQILVGDLVRQHIQLGALSTRLALVLRDPEVTHRER